ncbi:FACT complex subunit spt16 [Dispira simplex]|nr:FACT complex subunit spt16 [Dispira simplex]
MSADTVTLDVELFHERAHRFVEHWKAALKTDPNPYHQTQVILVPMGIIGEETNPYQKTRALHVWLWGYEFPNTLMVLTPSKWYFVTSSSKAKLLEPLCQTEAHDQVPIEVLRLTKDAQKDNQVFKQVVDILRKAGPKVGVFPKDTPEGKTMNVWEAVYKAESGFEEVDVSIAMGEVLACKDNNQLDYIEMASKLTSLWMTNYFTDKMTGILDEEREITHVKLSETMEGGLWDPKAQKAAKFPAKVNQDALDWCYMPIIQSGGQYDLRPSAMSNEDKLHAGTVVCSMGVRYRYYCSNLARTFMISPSKTQEKNYNFLLDLQQHILKALRPGIPAKQVYQKAVEYIRKERPDLEKHFMKNCGFAMGTEFRETGYVLNAKNDRELQPGMVFNLALGFQDLANPKASDKRGKTYALLLSDTVLLPLNGGSATSLTDSPKGLGDAAFYFDDDEEEEESVNGKRNSGDRTSRGTTKSRNDEGQDTSQQDRPRTREGAAQTRRSAVLSSKFRSEERDDETAEQKRREHQRELAAQKQAEGLARFPANGNHQQTKDEVQLRKFESYKREAHLPREVQRLQIVLDTRSSSVVLPVYGMAVPFHISTIKNVSKTEEGAFVLLRINFVTPGQVQGRKESVPFDDVNANFLRSITFRSTDMFRLGEICQQIQDMKKSQAKRDAEKQEMADIVVQDKLVETRGRRPIQLRDVFARPDVVGKRAPGELEIHANGLRYQHPLKRDQRIDILFSNIRHVFFQPCDHELIVLLHIHLKNFIMVGKKKTKDIQFYREASDAQFDETGNRRRYRYGDEDELQAEQEERKRRAKLNQEFRRFAQQLVDQSDGQLEVDIPFRDLGFHGVAFRSNVFFQPTTECLVQLTDTPVLVITMADVEIAHLERVQFGLKNFDLVFVFKDFKQPPAHINTIPMTQLDHVKEWLDSMDVVFAEGPVNLNWTAIMKTVQEDPAAFFQDGGWGFLLEEGDSEGDSELEEEESEFEMSQSDFGSEVSSEEDSEFSSAVATESDESDSDDESEESGEDWDQLEEKARRYDERKRHSHEDDDDTQRSHKRSRK